MFTDLICFTTDATPTTVYANVHLGFALESKGCNYVASPNITPYQMVSDGVSRDNDEGHKCDKSSNDK